jgi:hypothetical protein
MRFRGSGTTTTLRHLKPEIHLSDASGPVNGLTFAVPFHHLFTTFAPPLHPLFTTFSLREIEAKRLKEEELHRHFEKVPGNGKIWRNVCRIEGVQAVRV